MGCLNHNITPAASEEPSESPTTAITVSPSIYSGWGCILMTTVVIEVTETHNICMKKT